MHVMKKLVFGNFSKNALVFTRYYATASATEASSAVSPETMLKNSEIKMKKNLEENSSVVMKFEKDMSSKAKLWNEQYEIYYGKERDTSNYPMLKVNEHHPKVRMGFIPDSWFQAFYEKTGVTGPYLFLFGGTTFLLSKEFWVMDHEFFEIPPLILMYVVVTKLYGAKIAAFFDKDTDKQYKNLMEGNVERHADYAKKFISSAKTIIENESGQKHLFDAKREIVQMQIEANYRERLVNMHKAIKNRLDYQVEREVSKRKMQQDYMVNWIVDNVVKSITPQLEKAMFSQCLKDLQALAPKR